MKKPGIALLASLILVASVWGASGSAGWASSESMPRGFPVNYEQDQSSNGQDRLGIYAQELGGAVGTGCPSCLIGGGLVLAAGLLAWGNDDPQPQNYPLANRLGISGLVLLAVQPAISAGSAYLVGRRIDPGGSLWGALGLSYGGAVVGYGLAMVSAGGPITTYLMPVWPVLGSAVGAVAGYNLFRSHSEASAWQQRIGLPILAVVPDPRTKGGSPRVEARLVSVRF